VDFLDELEGLVDLWEAFMGGVAWSSDRGPARHFGDGVVVAVAVAMLMIILAPSRVLEFPPMRYSGSDRLILSGPTLSTSGEKLIAYVVKVFPAIFEGINHNSISVIVCQHLY
jgi:hypothetical protein